MSESEKTIAFKARDFKGSRFRCLQLTSLPKPELRHALAKLIEPFGIIPENFKVYPRGFLNPDESILTQQPSILTEPLQIAMRQGWLNSGSRTPNWDLVSTCRIDGKDGLLLVEAKAHHSEFKVLGDSCEASEVNLAQIKSAIQEANEQLAISTNTNPNLWHLSTRECYQLSNRLAWTWKLASLGIPTILAYLGCLNCTEWNDAFTTHEDWEQYVLKSSQTIVPQGVWNQTWQANGTTFALLIRSLDINIHAGSI